MNTNLFSPKLSTWFKGLLGLVLVVILAAALSIFLNLQTAKTEAPTQPTNQTSISQQNTPTPSQPSPTDPTAGWKKFTNISDRYSIKYPPNWSLREVPNVVFSGPNIEKTPGGTIVGGGEIVIFINDNPLTKPLAEFYLSNLSTDFHIIEQKEISINNLAAMRYVGEGAGIDGTITGVMVATGNKLYRIEAYYGRKDKDKTIEVLELMLKSMKITAK